MKMDPATRTTTTPTMTRSVFVARFRGMTRQLPSNCEGALGALGASPPPSSAPVGGHCREDDHIGAPTEISNGIAPPIAARHLRHAIWSAGAEPHPDVFFSKDSIHHAKFLGLARFSPKSHVFRHEQLTMELSHAVWLLR